MCRLVAPGALGRVTELRCVVGCTFQVCASVSVMLTQEDLPTMHFSECVPLLGDTVPSPLPSYADHGFIADVWVVAGPQRPRLRLAGWLVGHGLKSRSGRLAAPQESGHMPDLCLHRPRGLLGVTVLLFPAPSRLLGSAEQLDFFIPTEQEKTWRPVPGLA